MFVIGPYLFCHFIPSFVPIPQSVSNLVLCLVHLAASHRSWFQQRNLKQKFIALLKRFRVSEDLQGLENDQEEMAQKLGNPYRGNYLIHILISSFLLILSFLIIINIFINCETNLVPALIFSLI